jgi:alpha-N-acetylglucosamine transferase
LALARSLKAVGSRWPLLVLAKAEASANAKEGAPDLEPLAAEGCLIRTVAQPPLSAAFRARHERAALHAKAPYKGIKPAFHDPLDNYCKLELWRLAEYQRVVFLDADTLVLQNIDNLFGYPEFCAAPNLYETLEDMHRLNSGVFVAAPREATYHDMLARLDVPGMFWRRTDQTFLEHYFPNWHGLPYTYNALQYIYFNLPQLWRWDSIKVVHYQFEKPWQADNGKAEALKPLIDLWHGVLEGKPIAELVPGP